MPDYIAPQLAFERHTCAGQTRPVEAQRKLRVWIKHEHTRCREAPFVTNIQIRLWHSDSIADQVRRPTVGPKNPIKLRVFEPTPSFDMALSQFISISIRKCTIACNSAN